MKFSIIMPCYNSEKYVRNAVESVVNQSFFDWELIAINDGSSDCTLDILKEYMGKDKRIKVFSKENGGYVSAVNLGLEKITGEYFLMMGSDDCLSTQLIFSLNEAAKAHYADMIVFRTLRFEKGKCKGLDKYTTFEKPFFKKNIDIKELEKEYPEHVKIISKRDTSKAFKTELLGTQRYYGKFGYDVDDIFSILFSHRATSFEGIIEDGYLLTVRPDSVSGSGKNFSIAKDCLVGWTEFSKQMQNIATDQLTDYDYNRMRYIYDSECEVLRRMKIFDKESIRLIKETRKEHIKLQKIHGVRFIPKSRLIHFLYYHIPLLWMTIFRVLSQKI